MKRHIRLWIKLTRAQWLGLVTIVIDEGFYHMHFVAVIAYISTKYMFFFFLIQET